MSLGDLGASAVASGWRAKVTDAVAERLDASSVPLNERQVRAALGFGFLALSVRHVAETIRRYRARSVRTPAQAPEPGPPPASS
jgi:hypothetical protein